MQKIGKTLKLIDVHLNGFAFVVGSVSVFVDNVVSESGCRIRVLTVASWLGRHANAARLTIGCARHTTHARHFVHFHTWNGMDIQVP